MRSVIVLPTYNERENLTNLVPIVLGLDPSIEILVVDDDSRLLRLVTANLQQAGYDVVLNDIGQEQLDRALASIQHYQDKDSGYSKQQSTRPQSLGYGLVDSPAGQAAAFSSWR